MKKFSRSIDKKNLRILFIGSAESSRLLLKKCISLKLNIVGVCTKKNSKNSDFVDLKKNIKNKKIDFKYIKKINSPSVFTWIKNKSPNLIFCFGWSEILKKKIINLPSIATVGFHPTKLPKNRGKHPIIWSLALGLKRTASSFFLIKNEKVDSGKVISQKQVVISNEDNAASLYKKIMRAAIIQLEQIIRNFKKNKIRIINTNSKSNYWRRRYYSDGKIDWRMTAFSISNLIKALDKPYPYAHFFFKGKEIKVMKSNLISKKTPRKYENFVPGNIILKNNSFFDVRCGSGIIRILKTNKKINLKKTNYL